MILKSRKEWARYLVNQIDGLSAIRLDLLANDCQLCRHYEADIAAIDAELRDLYSQLEVLNARVAKKSRD
jgi:hypothetical protein